MSWKVLGMLLCVYGSAIFRDLPLKTTAKTASQLVCNAIALCTLHNLNPSMNELDGNEVMSVDEFREILAFPDLLDEGKYEDLLKLSNKRIDWLLVARHVHKLLERMAFISMPPADNVYKLRKYFMNLPKKCTAEQVTLPIKCKYGEAAIQDFNCMQLCSTSNFLLDDPLFVLLINAFIQDLLKEVSPKKLKTLVSILVPRPSSIPWSLYIVGSLMAVLSSFLFIPMFFGISLDPNK